MRDNWVKYEQEKARLKVLLANGKLTHRDFEQAIRRLARRLKV